MRVTVLTEWFPPEKAGIPRDIAIGLAETGHLVGVLTAFPNYPTGKIYPGWRQRPFQDSNVDAVAVRRVWHLPSHDRSPLRRALTYFTFAISSAIFGWRMLRKSDVVYVYHPPLTAALGAWFANVLRSVPYVLHIQDLWPDSVVASGLMPERRAPWVARLLAAACNRIYRRAAGIICIAPSMADILAQRGVPRERLSVVPNWADESIFHPSTEFDPSAAKRDRVETVVMFAGNIGHVQGLDTAIRAAAKLRDLRGFRLEIVGDGLALEELKFLAAELQAGNVDFRDSVPLEAMQPITISADAQLVCLRDLPLFAATIPSKIAATMACGTPTVCAVAGDATKLVRLSASGWTCPPEDVDALAEVFRKVAYTPSSELAAYGQRAYTYYREHLSRSRGVHSINTVLIGAANGHRDA